MTRNKRILAGAIAVLIAGCAKPPAGETEQPPVAPPAKVQPPQSTPAISDSDSLLAYYEHMRKLSPPEFARESELVRKLYARAKTEVVRIRYAMLLAVTPGAPVEEARATEILEPVLNSQDANLRALAMLINMQLQEQRRAHGLQQKLDALMSLDKSMIERGSKAP